MIKHTFRGDRCFSTSWQHLVDSMKGCKHQKAETVQISNSQMRVRNQTGTQRRSTKCPVVLLSSPSTLFACCPLMLSCFAHHCTCTAVCLRSASQWLVFFYLIRVQSLCRVFFVFFLGRREGHWLSSRAQTCCGHPVRPFTFFSAPKDSCRPSVCDTRNTKSSSAGGQINTGSLALVCSGLALDITTFPATSPHDVLLQVYAPESHNAGN